MPKRYDLIPELDNQDDCTNDFEAGDMERGNTRFMKVRIFLMIFGGFIGLIFAGILVYKFVFARTNDAWWLTTLTWIAGIYMGWLALRLFIRFYIQMRLQDPEYDWRPAGTHISSLRGYYAGFEGKASFPCPYCSQQHHVYKIQLKKLCGGVIYSPALLDPIDPTSIVYHRKLRIPVTCPTTNKPFQGTVTLDQCSKEVILNAEAIATLA